MVPGIVVSVFCLRHHSLSIRAISASLTSSRSARILEGQIIINGRSNLFFYARNKQPNNRSSMADDQAPRPEKRSALVLYASETGNAQEVAEELGDLAERLHFVTLVSEMNNFKPVG